MGTSAERFDVHVSAGRAAVTEDKFSVEFDVAGISVNELTRIPEWEVDVWGGWNEGSTLQVKPTAFTSKDGRNVTTLELPMTPELRLFFETRPTWATVRVQWNKKKS